MSPQSKDETPTPRCDAPTPLTDALVERMSPRSLMFSSGEKVEALISHARQLERALLAAERDAARLREAIEDALEDIAGYEDVADGSYGEQVPNRAMHAGNTLRAALAGKQEEGR